MAFIGNQPTAVPLTSSQLADGLITSAKIADGAVVNVDVNSTAAIAYSKLNLATSIVNGDIANATIALAKLSATGTPSASTFLRGDNSWASAGAAAGQVIQVLSATDSTERTTNSSSFVTASNTLSVTITPSSASNKIFLVVNSNLYSPDTNAYYFGTIFRGATDLGASSNKGLLALYNASSDASLPLAMSILDDPNTTSATTYQVYIRNTGGGTIRLNIQNQKASITAFEIKG